MRILIFGGTTEGRELAAGLCALGGGPLFEMAPDAGREFVTGQESVTGHEPPKGPGTGADEAAAEKTASAVEVTVSCATAIGAEQMAGIPCRVLCGRLAGGQISALAEAYDLVVDATHPYADQVSALIRRACDEKQKPLYRIFRAGSHPEGGLYFPDAAAVCGFLQGTEGPILLTTGAKELPLFAALDPERLYARVLPVHASLEACEEIGLKHSHILAMQGPFGYEMNLAMLHQYGIRYLVTKDGGRQGGFEEKARAAEAAGADLLVIRRPESAGDPAAGAAETAWSVQDLIEEVKRLCR